MFSTFKIPYRDLNEDFNSQDQLSSQDEQYLESYDTKMYLHKYYEVWANLNYVLQDQV